MNDCIVFHFAHNFLLLNLLSRIFSWNQHSLSTLVAPWKFFHLDTKIELLHKYFLRNYFLLFDISFKPSLSDKFLLSFSKYFLVFFGYNRIKKVTLHFVWCFQWYVVTFIVIVTIISLLHFCFYLFVFKKKTYNCFSQFYSFEFFQNNFFS